MFDSFGSVNPTRPGDLSALGEMYGPPGSLTASELESRLHPHKAMLSEFGWAYLINDGNAFSPVYFGENGWPDGARAAVAALLAERKRRLAERGQRYLKFIVPEKIVVYPEYLPRVLKPQASLSQRPAQMMAADSPDLVTYLDQCLIGGKSYGLSFFRGDTHTNWLGSWLVYRGIADRLAAAGIVPSSAILPLAALTPSIAGWDGDIIDQAGPEHRAQFDAIWGVARGAGSFETLLMLTLADQHRRASLVSTPDYYRAEFTTRETFVYERADREGPTAVIFRDSTLDRTHELLAQHFKRSVFIWHHGQVYQDVLDREKPDIVLHIMAERFVVMYPGFPAIWTGTERSGAMRAPPPAS